MKLATRTLLLVLSLVPKRKHKTLMDLVVYGPTKLERWGRRLISRPHNVD